MNSYCKYFLKTILDIGLKRLLGRSIDELRKKLYKFLPNSLILILANANSSTPNFKETLNNLKLNSLNYWSSKKEDNEIGFKFLNVSKKFSFPISWNDQNLSQLWRFNLHYFDWAREFIENRLENGYWVEDAKNLMILIDDWIENNKIGKGDGWHSYTISLRIRNWILIMRTCPEFNQKKYIDSLWLQICWLYSHKEDFLGGNHWLENLISLIIGSLQFEGKKADMIFNYSFKELEIQLNEQIMGDGGHQERSSTYHLLILERLIELGLIIENILGSRPQWLINSISKMKDWVISIRLNQGNYPIFNDSPDISLSIDEILDYSNAYLKKLKLNNKGLKTSLTQIYLNGELDKVNFSAQSKLTTLIDTGWSIVRFQNGIDFIFKFGDSCPKHLPAHAHSDLFSFDVYKNGEPILVETGTSTYGLNTERYYERSSAAHNIFQLAPLRTNKKNNIQWVEPIEVWGNFRAARKANIIDKLNGIYPNGNVWIKGTHDAFERYGAKYSRSIELEETLQGGILFKVFDKVDCKKRMFWRQFWHLGPDQSDEFLSSTIDYLNSNYEFEKKWLDTYYSKGFGKRIKRKTLKLMGIINPGIHYFKSTFIIPNV